MRAQDRSVCRVVAAFCLLLCFYCLKLSGVYGCGRAPLVADGVGIVLFTYIYVFLCVVW